MTTAAVDAAPARGIHPLADRLAAGRECGACTVCCKVMKIDQAGFFKPGGVYCHQCRPTGCAVHATRPEVCRGWFCLWRRIKEMPEEARPDRIGIIFSFETRMPPPTPFEKMFIVGRAVDDPAVFELVDGQAALGMFVREGTLPVFTSFNQAKRRIYPAPDFADAILDPVNTVYRELVPAALTWRQRYGMT